MPAARTIQIIDDSKVSRMMIKAVINDLKPDWSVIESGDADEAIKESNQQSIDYFSVDLNMPGKDGLELITLLKQSFPQAKFALLTANIQEHTHKSAKELGAACINKPITETSIKKMLEFFNE